LKGQLHTPADDEAAIELVLELIGGDPIVISWERLPLPGLTDALARRSVEIVIPRARGDQRAAELAKAEPIRVGITGADAAFATTGTLVLVTDEMQGRLPSLLPPVHIALLRREQLFPRLEDWITVEGRATLARSSSVAFVSGPSRTGDIEMQLVLGVHGPGAVHVVLLP
jgi:L-lactate dehydrogenase complex protein LldG